MTGPVTPRPVSGTAVAGVLLGGLLLSACDGGLQQIRALGNAHTPVASNAFRVVAGGDPARGAALLRTHACTTCHVVPGMRGVTAPVGPPLAGFARRTHIGGSLPNQPELLVRFLMNAPRELPGTAMPDLKIAEPDARDIAALLYTLR